MPLKALICFAAILLAATEGRARLTRAWTWQEMFDQADLVVIARPTATKDTSEHSKLLTDIPVIGVHTDFETRLILKGSRGLTSFTLHHYRFERPEEEKYIANGPNLIRLEMKPGQRRTYLLFLRREEEGVYAPVTNQTDPYDTCVNELPGYELTYHAEA